MKKSLTQKIRILKCNLHKSIVYLFIILCFTLSAEDDIQYPVDVSFVVVDLKYSTQHGVKICEVQQGILSAFRGDRFAHEGDPVISGNFVSYVSKFYDKSWALKGRIADSVINTMIKESPKWEYNKRIRSIITDSEFLKRARAEVSNPYSLDSYHGFVFGSPKELEKEPHFRKHYPGVVVIDAATHPYWVDKYKMSELFNQDPTLVSFRPRWNLYPKKYTPTLSNKILEDIGGDLFVIKPRGAFCGNGVIIVSKEDLDSTLCYIFSNSGELKRDSDPSYQYWAKDMFDSFLVEEFFESDYIEQNQQIYQPTIRMVFILTYDNQMIHLEELGSYCQLPSHPVNGVGSLNKRHKARCKEPYYSKVDPETYKKILDELKIALPLLYRQMLLK